VRARQRASWGALRQGAGVRASIRG
jgi:hypothetical protein